MDKSKIIRTAALGHHALGTSRVKITFRENGRRGDMRGKEYAYWVTQEHYDKFPLGEDVSLQDFENTGSVVEAENTDIYSNK